MRIGIDCRIYGKSHGYIGTYIENLVSHLDQSEDTNEYVLFFDDKNFGEFLPKSPRIRTVKTGVKIGSISEQILFPRELLQVKLDHMFFSHPCIPFLYRKKTTILLVDLVAYFYPEKYLKWWLLQYWKGFILRHSIRKSDTIIALSDVLKHDLIEIFDIQEERISVIPPMFPELGNTPMGKENEIQQFLLKEGISKKYILSVGELREYKNIPRLLQAYDLFLKESWEDIDLVLVGKEDPTYHEVRSIIIQLGLQNRVHIYNMLDVTQMRLLYQNALFFVLSSLYESTELVLLMAMACELPITSAILPSITNILSKEDVVFFRPMSIPDMQSALTQFLIKPLWKQKKKDMDKYSISSVSKKIVETFSR